MLNMKLVDELHVMRKTVVDGSTVSGFQRTALLSYNGHVDTDKGRVGIINLSIEEDSAPKILEGGIRIAVEVINQLREIEGVAGIHIMTLQREEIIPKICSATGIYPRP